MSRNGIPSDWSAPKAFPGIVNPSVVYRFDTFAVNVDSTPFIQIDFNEFGGTANLFASAYLNSYNPASLASNYLGDAGFSGNFFGVDPLTFQVFVPSNQDLVVLVNDTTGFGVGTPFEITVEGFVDANFTDTPEPASWLLAAAGLAVIGASGRRRRSRISPAS